MRHGKPRQSRHQPGILDQRLIKIAASQSSGCAWHPAPSSEQRWCQRKPVNWNCLRTADSPLKSATPKASAVKSSQHLQSKSPACAGSLCRSLAAVILRSRISASWYKRTGDLVTQLTPGRPATGAGTPGRPGAVRARNGTAWCPECASQAVPPAGAGNPPSERRFCPGPITAAEGAWS